MDENEIIDNYEQIRAAREWDYSTLSAYLAPNDARLAAHFRAKAAADEAAKAAADQAKSDPAPKGRKAPAKATAEATSPAPEA